MDLFRPVPLPIGHRLEAAEARVSEPAFDALARAGVELGLDEVFEQDDGTPALLRRARDEIIQLGRRCGRARAAGGDHSGSSGSDRVRSS